MENTFGIDGRTFAAIVRHAEKCGVTLETTGSGTQLYMIKGDYRATVMPLNYGQFILWNAYTGEKNVEATLDTIKKHMSALSWE